MLNSNKNIHQEGWGVIPTFRNLVTFYAKKQKAIFGGQGGRCRTYVYLRDLVTFEDFPYGKIDECINDWVSEEIMVML